MTSVINWGQGPSPYIEDTSSPYSIFVSFSVVYSGNGSTGGSVPVDSNSYVFNASATILGNIGSLVRAGYTFSGWNTASNGSGTTYQAGNTRVITGAVTLYAMWSANTNTIIFNANGGSGYMAAQSMYTGQVSNLIGNTYSRIGYTFAGWNTVADGSGTSYADMASYTMGTANVTLYAQWGSGQNTISFNANGGTGSMAPMSVATGTTVNLTTNTIIRTGYAFANWNTAADGSGVNYADSASITMGVMSIVLYAQWSATLNTVQFNSNGGTGVMVNQSIATGATLNLTANSFTRSGYIFSGWNTLTNGSGTSYADGAPYTMGVSSVILYAQWSVSTNTIGFNANGGTGSMLDQTIAVGQSASLTANAFTRAGYVFLSWNTTANGSGFSYADSAMYTMGSSSSVLYAQWAIVSIKYTVVYNSNNASSSIVPIDTSSPYNSGVIVVVMSSSVLAVPIGYAFMNWNTKSDGTGIPYLPNGSFVISSNVVLYAQWIKAPVISDLSQFSTIYSLLPMTYDIEFIQGDYVTVPMRIWQGSTSPKPLSGYTLEAYITLPDGVMPFTVTVSDQVAAPGQIILSLAMVQTNLLSGDYPWELYWLDPASNKRTLIVGTVMVGLNE